MQEQIPFVVPTEAHRMAADGAVLLDVREPVEWAAGHAPDAVHLPLGALTSQPPEPGRPIVVVCRSGQRSANATLALREWGYEAVNLDGGMKAWMAAGLPIVTDDGQPGHVA